MVKGKMKKIQYRQKIRVPAQGTWEVNIEAKARVKHGEFSGKLIIQSDNDVYIDADGKIKAVE